MSRFKAITDSLITISRKAKRNEEEDDGDLLDKSIIPHIEILNNNPDFVITGSCSGHGGDPYFSVIFKDSNSRDSYLKKVRAAKIDSQKSEDYRMTFFEDNYPADKISEEWTFGYKRKVSDKKIKEFFKLIIWIFG